MLRYHHATKKWPASPFLKCLVYLGGGGAEREPSILYALKALATTDSREAPFLWSCGWERGAEERRGEEQDVPNLLLLLLSQALTFQGISVHSVAG